MILILEIILAEEDMANLYKEQISEMVCFCSL